MKRKTLISEWGLGGLLASLCTLILLTSQVYLEVVGDKAANWKTWAVVGVVLVANAALIGLCARHVRRHNAMVDRYETRNEWQRLTRPKRGEHDDFESQSDPGPYWHQPPAPR